MANNKAVRLPRKPCFLPKQQLMKPRQKTKVLIVEDAETTQKLFTQLINADSDCLVVGVANDAYEARDMIKLLNPDVITLALKKQGARTFAEHEETCVVYGMPLAAYKLGATKQMVPLYNMTQTIIEALPKQNKLCYR